MPQGQQGFQNHLWQWGLTVHFNSCSPAPGVLVLVLGHLHTLPRAPQSPELLREWVQGLVWEGWAQDGVLPLPYQDPGHGLPASGPAPGAAAVSTLCEFLPLLNQLLDTLVLFCRA